MSRSRNLIESLQDSDSIDESFDMAKADAEDSINEIVKFLKKSGAVNSSKEMSDLKKSFSSILKKAEKEVIKLFADKLKPYMGKEYKVPFLGTAKIITARGGPRSYFLELEDSSGAKFSISHKESGSWDSKLEVGDKNHKLYPGGYGPHGNHKFPDVDGLLKSVGKIR